MKTLLKFFFLMAIISLIAGCNKPDAFVEEIPDTELKSAQVTVTVPFKADFTVKDYSDLTDRSCGEPPVYSLTMRGDGNINHMGHITTEMTFCCNITTGEYGNTICTFIAANGDELYATIPTGQILPNEGDNSDYYETYFNDKMYFNGGTGRFEGASGEAMTNMLLCNGFHKSAYAN